MPPLPFAGKMPSLESLASFQYFWFWHVAKLLPLVTYNVSVISRKIWRSCTLDHLSSTAHMKQNDKTGESGFSRKAQKSPERRVVVLFWARRCISRVWRDWSIKSSRGLPPPGSQPPTHLFNGKKVKMQKVTPGPWVKILDASTQSGWKMNICICCSSGTRYGQIIHMVHPFTWCGWVRWSWQGAGIKDHVMVLKRIFFAKQIHLLVSACSSFQVFVNALLVVFRNLCSICSRKLKYILVTLFATWNQRSKGGCLMSFLVIFPITVVNCHCHCHWCHCW